MHTQSDATAGKVPPAPQKLSWETRRETLNASRFLHLHARDSQGWCSWDPGASEGLWHQHLQHPGS